MGVERTRSPRCALESTADAVLDIYSTSQARERVNKPYYVLFKSPLRLSAEDPILWPFSTIDITLRIVVLNCLLLRYIVLVAIYPRSLSKRPPELTLSIDVWM